MDIPENSQPDNLQPEPERPRPENEWVLPIEPDSVARGATDPPASAAPRSQRLAKLAVPLIAAALVGAGAVIAIDHATGSTASANGATPSALSGGQAPPGGFGGGGGGVAGERRFSGTVTAKTATTVTIKSSSGTATYTVNATTQIVRNGQAATLADVKVGDPVFVHVYPSSSGQMLVEHLFAGSSASGGGGFGPPGSSGSGTASGPTA